MSEIRNAVLEFLSHREVANDETVEFGWFIFTIDVKNDTINLKTLDFQEMASFTDDFSKVDVIHQTQMLVLENQNVESCSCTLRHSAIISRSYRPGQQQVFMHRLSQSEQNDSGWYVGVIDDPLDVNDANNLTRQSLYELSIHDLRLLPFWLLPDGYLIQFNGEAATISVNN
jgi:hypothetical protein